MSVNLLKLKKRYIKEGYKLFLKEMKESKLHLKDNIYYDEELVSQTPFFTKDVNKFYSIIGRKYGDEFLAMDIESYGVNMFFENRDYYVLDEDEKREDIISLKYMKASVRGESILGGEWGLGFVLTGKSQKLLDRLKSPYKNLIPEIY